jgi:excisionase family DNA binding protein
MKNQRWHMQTKNKPFASVKEVASRFGVCPHTLYEKIRLGIIPSYRFGRKILLDPEEVRNVLRVVPKVKGGSDAA